MGGLKINADAEILDTQGNVIPGLYAAGETTGGTQSAGPYELRLPIFLQPLGGALKNRSAAPASPPCFRRRRTGCGTQHPLRLACVSLAAAPTTPRCFRRWRRSSSLQSASLLFESTHLCESDICAEENRQCISTPAVFSWARVDYASRASKKAPRGLFAAGTYSGGRCCSNPPLRRFTNFQIKQKLQCHYNTGVLGGAKQPKSEPLPSGASLAAISSKVMVFVPSL